MFRIALPYVDPGLVDVCFSRLYKPGWLLVLELASYSSYS